MRTATAHDPAKKINMEHRTKVISPLNENFPHIRERDATYDQTGEACYPIFYVYYRLLVQNCKLYREGYNQTPESNTTGGHTNPDFEYGSDFHRPSEDLPPWEVQFDYLLFSEFKDIFMRRVDIDNPFFHVSEVLTRAEKEGVLQWRGSVSYPGGPPPSLLQRR